MGRLEAELRGVHAENTYLNTFEAQQHGRSAPPPPPPLGSAPARPLRLLRARLAALGSP